MKIVHWSIIFIAIILPFSIICRTTIQQKILVLQDQTTINNALDNATYDAVGQIIEVSEELGYGKNIPITKNVAEAAIDRFFQSLAVNFNLPSNIDVSKEYFGQYIPVILIVGYDGVFVYSYELTDEGYKYVMKPKIPYAYTISESHTNPNLRHVINFTLGNDIKMYIPALDLYFAGTLSDKNQTELDISTLESALVNYTSLPKKREFIEKYLARSTANASLVLYAIEEYFGGTAGNIPDYLFDRNNLNKILEDYEYNEKGLVIRDASDFHKLRRDVIINLITSILSEEVNEHNTYADLIGVTYNFNIPNIGKDQWNNTIDDISILAFFQGMPIGTDSYYNNYSLGGARIVQANYFYATDRDGKKLYHKHNCPVMLGANNTLDDEDYDRIFIRVKDANEEGFYACKECR